MIPKGRLADLIKQEEDIFPEAGKWAHKKELIFSSPLVMTRACKVSPLCTHCSWRANRALMKNYAAAKVNKEEAVSRALHIQKSGASRVYLVSGWMGSALPVYFLDCIEAIKENTPLDITATFGAITKSDLSILKEFGVDRIACGLETTNAEVFHALKPGDNFQARLDTLLTAKEMGFKISTNFLVGIGETIDDLDNAIRLAEQLGIDFLSIAALEPTPFTETERWDRPSPYRVAKIAASARLVLPHIDITASFGCGTYTDLAWGMKSGANAFTIALRNPSERPELLGDEKNRVEVMWKDFSTPKNDENHHRKGER